MPAQRPRAAFEPISPDIDINALVEATPNFAFVDRISVDQIDEQGVEAFEHLVLLHVIKGGKPLVIDGFENRLDPWTFSPKWLNDNVGSKVEHSRNLATKESLPLTIGHYLKNMGKLANQFFENARNYKDKSRQRIYLKDIDCPQVWQDKLQEHIPPSLFYLNETTGEVGGPGANPHNPAPGPRRRANRGAARSGDLMSSLPPEMRAENLMCYIGHEGTYTPAHREMCATMGHNIMVEASRDVGEDGKPERPGSSVWFMTESSDRNTVSEYWLSVLGHDIEVESHFAQVSAWKRAPFTVYVVEQRPGDFILIPPLAPHQVWNRGTRTMKVAWNRTTVETLGLALTEALPRARIVCRDEQYKNKAIAYYTLMQYSSRLAVARSQAQKLRPDHARELMHTPKIKQLIREFRKLLDLFRDILLDESFSPDNHHPEKYELVPFDGNVTCAYCRGNIFNRFLSCPNCKDFLGHEEEEPYDICMDCYAMGRSCACISNLKWTEQFKWKELTTKYESWRKQLIDIDGGSTKKTPPPWLEARKALPNKTLAEVCREQLKRRPYVDVTKSKQPSDDEEEDIIVDDEGRVKKTVKKKSKTWLKTHSACHICCKRHPNWKSAKCTTCDKCWCYGSLFRGADMMPLTIMQDPNWSCPHCRGVCFAGACRKDPRQNPYEPKSTLLGHDTKKVADARSVECLVDFSVSNLTWLRDDDEDVQESVRIRRAREEAQRAKAVDHYMEDEEDNAEMENDMEQSHVRFDYSPEDESFIDPQLMGNDTTSMPKQRAALRDESSVMQPLSQADRSLPPPDAMLQGARLSHSSSPFVDPNDVPDGYAPATTGEFMAPSAPTYGEQSAYAYPDPDATRFEDVNEPQPISSLLGGEDRRMKRGPQPQDDKDEINMEGGHAKRRRISDDPARLLDKPRNEATKQFEREKERKALDEAKKQGRFVAAQAALRGKKRIVKLRISGPRLAQLLAQQAAKAFQSVAETPDVDQEAVQETVLVRSDIAPAKKDKTKKAVQNPNKMKIRVERDDDFSMRGAEARRKRHHPMEYEEVNIDMESDGEAEYTGVRPKDGKRRISSYIQKKHLDDPDFPDELPENYKDSRSGRIQKAPQPAVRRPGPAGRSRTAQKEAAAARKSQETPIPQLDGAYDDEDSASEAPTPPSHTAGKTYVSTFEEDNRRAKLEMLKMVQDESSRSASPATATATPPTRGGPSSIGRSIFDKRSGKKVKIVSSSARSSLAGKK